MERLNADGTRSEVVPAGATITLAELQAIVGGYIEILRLDDGRAMVLNEDGKRLGLPQNDAATRLAHARTGISPFDWIVGDVVVGTWADVGGGS